MIIDERYFTYPETYVAGIDTMSSGQLSPTAQKIIAEVNTYIRKYEPRFLRALLGPEVAQTIDQYPELKKRLANPKEGTSVIAKYVYFMYSRDKSTFNTMAGEKVKNTENSTRVSAAQRLARVWNDMSDECWDIINTTENVELAPNMGDDIFCRVNIFNL